MKKALFVALAMLAGSAFAQSSTTTGNNGTGVQMGATASQTVGGKIVTITVGNTGMNTLKATPNPNGAGTSIGTMSAGLSIGATLGGGFGNTGGTAGTSAFAFK